MNGRRSIAMIAAVGPNMELGSRGDLIWHISADLKNFKALTMGRPVIMGRKTWESLPKRPLPGRLNIVMTRSGFDDEGVLAVASPAEAIEVCPEGETAFIIGGEQIYNAFLPLADTLYITQIEAESPKRIDAWFPEFRHDWHLQEAGDWQETPEGVRFRFEKWSRN